MNAVRRALVSVYDKTGVADLALGLHDAGVEIISTGSTARVIAEAGVPVIEDALAYGVKVTGCTVHVATLEMDAGPILAQEAVPVLPDDTVATLHERIKEVERRLYPATVLQAVEVLAAGRTLGGKADPGPQGPDANERPGADGDGTDKSQRAQPEEVRA